MGIKLDDGSRKAAAEKQHKQQQQRRPMGQRYAKHQMQSGVRVYHQRHYQQAIGRWRTALNRLKNAEDRFITLGYMAQAFCDCSDYESMLHYALQQMELANTRRDDFMKSEAFLNLSKAYERLADYGKAISYGRASLHHPNIDSRTPGYAHLGIALAHVGLSQFQSALETFERAMAVANDTGDKLLELQICVGLGTLFTLLRDLGKALIFLRNALSILQLVTADNVHAKYKSAILYHLSVVLRLKGSLADARQVCDEAVRLAYQTSNRATYARALASMADINRELGESEAKETITKSWARYEQSFRVMRQIKDRMGEVIVLGSMAKSASESRSHYTGQCECQAIQLNKKCLELAKLIGCKHAMMKCHLRLQDLYAQLEDEDSEEAAAHACVALIQEMELFCNFCGQRYGDRDDALQALRCSHIFHERCLRRFLTEGENLNCPKCKRRAVVMHNLSAHTSAESVEDAAVTVTPPPMTVAGRPLRFDTDVIFDEFSEPIDSVLFDPATGRKRLRLESYAKHEQHKQQQHTKHAKEQHEKQNDYSDLAATVVSLARARHETAPPSAEYVAPPPVTVMRAKAHATVRIPRTTSAPIYCPAGDAIYATFSNYAELNATREVTHRSARASESPQPSTSSNTSSTIRATARNFQKIPTRQHSVAGSVPTRSAALGAAATEIVAESSEQHFSLSASTSSVAFFPSASEGALWAASSTSASDIRTALEKSSTASLTSGERSSQPVGLQQTVRRLPSRAERLRTLAIGGTRQNEKLLPNMTDDCERPSTSGIKSLKIWNPLSDIPTPIELHALNSTKITSNCALDKRDALQTSNQRKYLPFNKAEHRILTNSPLQDTNKEKSDDEARPILKSFFKQSPPSVLSSAGTSDLSKFVAEHNSTPPKTQPAKPQLKAQPKKLLKQGPPPPPPRKPPCCGGADAFPPLPDDLLNAPPASLAFPSMLERAMRTVLEENEDICVEFDAFERACIVEYPPHATNDNSNKNNPLNVSGIVTNDVEHGGKLPNNIENVSKSPRRLSNEEERDERATLFIVHHEEGVTDV